ncbi:MAG: hypothetical protein ACI8YQ_003329 [Polaribacter sp.]|jgi:hypothetical protein
MSIRLIVELHLRLWSNDSAGNSVKIKPIWPSGQVGFIFVTMLFSFKQLEEFYELQNQYHSITTISRTKIFPSTSPQSR